MRFDLLIRNGHLIDPAAGLDARRDVAFAAGRVVAVEAGIPPGQAREVVDAAGAFVAPGLIDLHAHAFIAGQRFVTPDDVKAVAPWVLAHRLVVDGFRDSTGLSRRGVIEKVLARVPVPTLAEPPPPRTAPEPSRPEIRHEAAARPI